MMSSVLHSLAWDIFSYSFLAVSMYAGYRYSTMPYWSPKWGRRMLMIPTYLFIGWMFWETRFQDPAMDRFSQEFAESIVNLSAGIPAGQVLVMFLIMGYIGAMCGAQLAPAAKVLPDRWIRRLPTR